MGASGTSSKTKANLSAVKPVSESTNGAVWTLRLLGGLRLERGDERITKFPTKRAALILARLALSRYRQASRDDLADALWPDDFPDATRVRLRQELRRLKEALGDAGDIIEADRTWVKLREDLVDTDVWTFERLVARAKQLESPKARFDALKEAVSWVEGALVPESSEPWILSDRTTVQKKHVSALAALVDVALELGEEASAVEFGQHAVQIDPLSEEGCEALVKALRAVGDLAQSKRTYLEFESRMVRRLGTMPSEALRNLANTPLEKTGFAGRPSGSQPAEAVETVRTWHRPELPAQTYGRVTELTVISSWLEPTGPARLVTLTGPGGVGKTHLARVAGCQMEPSFKDRVAFVELVSESPKSILSAIIRAIGSDNAPALPDIEDFKEAIGEEPALLVLDNAEHIVQSVQELANELLGECPNLRMLVTSRKRLDLALEREFPISPLPTPGIADEDFENYPSVAMFIENARRYRKDFKVDRDQRPTLVMLLKRLEGMPLAVQLAAQQVDALSLREIFEGLDDSFTNLVQRDPNAAQRHTSMKSAFDWSFKLLSEVERHALWEFSLFPSGWNLELAQQLLSDADALEVIRSLIAASLIQAHETEFGTRYSMLESVRNLAFDSIPDELRDQLERKRASVLAEAIYNYSRDLRSADSERNYRMISQNLGSVHEAIDWAADHDHASALKFAAGLWRYYLARGDLQDAYQRMRNIFTKVPETQSDHYAEGIAGFAYIARQKGRFAEAEDLYLKGISVYDAMGRTVSSAWVEYNYAYMLFDCRRYAETLNRARSATAKLTAAVKPEALAEATLLSRGVESYALSGLGQHDDAMKLMEQVFADRLTVGLSDEIGKAYFELALVYLEGGREAASLPLLRTGIRHMRDLHIQNFLINGVSQLALHSDNDEERTEVLNESLALARRLHSKPHLIEMLTHKGRWERDLGVAKGIFAEALDIAQNAEEPYSSIRSLMVIAERLIEAEELGRAIAIANFVERIVREQRLVLRPSEERSLGRLFEILGSATPAMDWQVLLQSVPLTAACSLMSSFFRVEATK